MKRAVERFRPIHVTVNYADPSGAQPGGSPEGLSPFMAKVLDQLSLTAWLPAALLVTNVYLVAGMYLVRQPDAPVSLQPLKKTVLALNDKPIGIVLAVIAGIVLMTLVTQSLEFTSIRLLEGYWGGSIWSALPTWIGTQIQTARLRLLDRRADKVERKAFVAVADRVAEDFPKDDGLASAARLFGTRGSTADLDEAVLLAAMKYYYGKKWMRWAPAALRHRANSLSNKRSTYPKARSRLMPTSLGNALRSAEEQLVGETAGAKMRGYLYQHVDSIGPALMHQHNQYRNRLDMYAVMTILAVALAGLDAWSLPPVLPADVVPWIVAGYLALSYVSYRGAVSAATDYGAILLAIDRAIAARPSVQRSVY